MIDKTCKMMRDQFIESHICKLYKVIKIDYIAFQYIRKRGENNYQFKILVFEHGKGGASYYMSAGKINVDIN